MLSVALPLLGGITKFKDRLAIVGRFRALSITLVKCTISSLSLEAQRDLNTIY